MLSKQRIVQLVGMTGILLSIVYYTVIVSFVSHGVFTNVSTSELFQILTGFFIMLFLNLIFGVYYISQYEIVKKMERKLPKIVSEVNPDLSREEREEYAQKIALKLQEIIKK